MGARVRVHSDRLPAVARGAATVKIGANADARKRQIKRRCNEREEATRRDNDAQRYDRVGACHCAQLVFVFGIARTRISAF